MNQVPPPGFYPDPNGTQRWWDGQQWTARTQDSAPQPMGQAPAGQGFGTTAPQAPPSKRKTPWIIGGVLAAVLLVGGGITAAVMIGGDDDKQDEKASGPEDTVQAYFDALAEDDCEGMVDQVTERAAQEPSMNCDTYDRDSMDGVDASTEINDAEVDGDEATVKSRETFEHPDRDTFEADCTYELVKEDDAWLIDDANCDVLS